MFSVLGGLFGTVVMITSAPVLAAFALQFSSFEYFWLAVMGLGGAVFIGSASVLKACVTLLFGLLVSCVGMDNPAATPRFTLGIGELVGGVSLIPMVVGTFALSEILRNMTAMNAPPRIGAEQVGNIFKGMWALTKQYKLPFLRGSVVGTIIGIQPGSGPDMASWIAYAMSKRLLQGAREIRHRTCRRDHRERRRQ